MYKYLFMLLFLFSIPINADHSLSQFASEMEVKYKLPKDLLVNICTIESNWRNVKGAHGEIGVCQLRPSSVGYAFPALARASTGYFKYGDRGVSYIQLVLEQHGLYKGPIDGIFGKMTYVAVMSFQKDYNLKVDGVVGPRTWKAMFNDLPYPIVSLEDKLWNPKENIEIAAMYIARLSRVLKTNDRSILAIAYNGGENSWAVKYLKKLEKLYE